MKIDFIVDLEILTLSLVTFLIAIIEVSKHIKITPTAKMHWLSCQYNQVIVGYIRLCEHYNRSFINRDNSAFVLLIVTSYPKGFTTCYN